MPTVKQFGVGYDAAAALDGSEELSIVQGGVTVDTTTGDIAALATTAPGGATTQVQFNDAGVLSGDAGLTYNKTTDTITCVNYTAAAGGLFLTAASGTANAGLRVPHGTAPSAPTNGDVWTTTAGAFVHINGVTVGPLAAAGAVSDGDKGDVTVSSSGTVWTIDNGVVTNAKRADMAQATISGRADGAGTGVPTDLTGAQVSAISQGAGLDVDATGFRGIPQNAQTGNYTCVAADAGKHIYHASGAGAGDTYTIPANASVAYELGTTLTFINQDSNAVSIAITSDTLTLSSAGTTGTRTLAQNGIATAIKVTSTGWLISGTGLT